METGKYRLPVLLLLLILFCDQYLKVYIKQHFYLGEEIPVLGKWFRIHFTENYGMAFGMEFGGKTGKVMLTLFRIVFVGFISYYILKLIRKGTHTGYVCGWVLIVAGALGNIIDSIFYGAWFGYDAWFHGRVVDMFYFPIIQTTIPENWPFWAGEEFEFFRPVFNVADAAISIGFGLILLLQNKANKILESELQNPEENSNISS